MAERVTRETLDTRAANFNRRIELTGRHVVVEGRNGHYGLDEYEGTSCIRTLTVGTKREVADFLHAMMIGFDFTYYLRDEAE